MKIKLELFGASREFSNKDYLEFEIKEKIKIMGNFMALNKGSFNNEDLKFSSKLKK